MVLQLCQRRETRNIPERLCLAVFVAGFEKVPLQDVCEEDLGEIAGFCAPGFHLQV